MSAALQSTVRALRGGSVMWVHAGLRSVVREGDAIVTLSEAEPSMAPYTMRAPFKARVDWILPWSRAALHPNFSAKLLVQSVNENDALLALYRLPPGDDVEVAAQTTCGLQRDARRLLCALRQGHLNDRLRGRQSDLELTLFQKAQRGCSDAELQLCIADLMHHEAEAVRSMMITPLHLEVDGFHV